MKFEYPITSSYIRDWSLLDALREFGANALDAETRTGNKAIITYDAARKRLLFKNAGVTVSRDALLLGGTENANRNDTIGTYGEGMKMGFLVVARLGLSIVVRNGTEEKWVPTISFSEKWSAKVLQLDVTKAVRQVASFEIEIMGIEMETWEALKGLFLRLQPATNSIALPSGNLLADSELVGKVFCRGVFVMSRANFSYGYDFNNLTLNRDRKFTESIDAHMTKLWDELILQNPEKLDELYALLDRVTAEGSSMKYGVSHDVSARLAKTFREKFPNAYLAANTQEVEKFKHYGVDAVVVGSTLYWVLTGHVDTLDVFLKSNRYNVDKTYSLLDLSDTEVQTFNQALRLLNAIGVVKSDELRVSIVDFVDPAVKGVHEDSDVKISRSILSSFGKTVTYLVHEFAHDKGEDGEKAHMDALQDGLSAALDYLSRTFTV